ncbi:unnamed protein product [Amoebophrya sp. A25]|nr:unnamed protein product [Amoebophrya sp. A25]|eukprot:GSA25T00009949001.1
MLLARSLWRRGPDTLMASSTNSVIPKNSALKPLKVVQARMLCPGGLPYKSYGKGQFLINKNAAPGFAAWGLWCTAFGYAFWCLKWHHPGNYPPSWTDHERGWL